MGVSFRGWNIEPRNTIVLSLSGNRAAREERSGRGQRESGKCIAF